MPNKPGCVLRNLVDESPIGDWDVLERIAPNPPGSPVRYRCRCKICGGEHIVNHGNLAMGKSRKCRNCGSNRKVFPGDVYGDREVLSMDGRYSLIRCLRCEHEFWQRNQSLKARRKFDGCANCRVVRDTGMRWHAAGETWSLTDCVELLGVSKQRVYQLADAGRLERRIEEAFLQLLNEQELINNGYNGKP